MTPNHSTPALPSVGPRHTPQDLLHPQPGTHVAGPQTESAATPVREEED